MRLSKDSGSPRIILCPAIEYGQFSCVNVRYKIHLDQRSLVALALPRRWSKPIKQAIRRFPRYSFLEFRGGRFGIHPLNPFIEAARTAMELHCPLTFFGDFVDEGADRYSRYIEDNLFRSLGTDHYLRFRCGGVDSLKERFANMFLGSPELSGFNSIVVVFSPWQVRSILGELRPPEGTKRIRMEDITEKTITQHLDEWPYVLAGHEKHRDQYHPRDWYIRQLLIESSRDYPAFVNPRQFVKIEQYSRNLSCLRSDGSRWTPSLENLLDACTEIVGDGYARIVMDRALHYKIPARLGYDTSVMGELKSSVSLIGSEIWSRVGLERLSGKFRQMAAAREHLDYKQSAEDGVPDSEVEPDQGKADFGLKETGSERDKNDRAGGLVKAGDAYDSDGEDFPRYRWDMTEQIHWEKKLKELLVGNLMERQRGLLWQRNQRSNPDFKNEIVMKTTLEHFFQQVFSPEERMVEEFVTGLKDGINIRETIRDIERSRLFVNCLPRQELVFHGMVIELEEDFRDFRKIGSFSGNYPCYFYHRTIKYFYIHGHPMKLNEWGFMYCHFRQLDSDKHLSYYQRMMRYAATPDAMKEEFFSHCKGLNIIYISPSPPDKAERDGLKKKGVNVFHLPLSAVPRRCIDKARVFTWMRIG